jgi:hypothetical protein
MKPVRGLGYDALRRVANLRGQAKVAQGEYDPASDPAVQGIEEVVGLDNEDDYMHPDADELVLYIQNDGDLYERNYMPVVMNLLKKMKKGTYDQELAVKGWAYVVEAGAKKYFQDFPGSFKEGSWNKLFPTSVRLEAARQLEEYERSVMENGEYDYLLEKRGNKKNMQNDKVAQEEDNYMADVNSYAEDLKDRFKAGDIDEMSDAVHETVDGSQWIIYYGRNLEVLQNTRHEDNFEEQGMELDTSQGWRAILTQIAYWAMVGDLDDALSNLGWDGNSFGDDEVPEGEPVVEPTDEDLENM